jgi:protein phosphatase
VDGLSDGSGKFKTDREIKQLKSMIERVNLQVFEASEDDDTLRGMGSTLVCVLILGDKYIAANVGDSRLYHCNGETIRRVTTDHSFVEQLVMQGAITREEARVHPQRNIITRAMGVSPSVDVDVFEHDWHPGDILLLCSDGLHGPLEEDEILSILQSDRTLDEMCDTLTQAALDNGGTDNITLILIRCEEDETA